MRSTDDPDTDDGSYSPMSPLRSPQEPSASPTHPAQTIPVAPISTSSAPVSAPPPVHTEAELTTFIGRLRIIYAIGSVVESFMNFAAYLLSTPLSHWPSLYREELFWSDDDAEPVFYMGFNFELMSRHLTRMLPRWARYHQSSSSSGGRLVRRRGFRNQQQQV